AKAQLGFKGQANGFLPLMPEAHLKSAAQTCLKMVEDRANGKQFVRFTDKMPQNAFQLGLIALMFPNARIIHVKRHPLDTCISCFFQRFRVGHNYSYQLNWLGQYYRHYSMTMDHWRKVLPLPMLEVRYEDLVQEPETYSRKLIEFVELDWRDDCLNPQDADRSVMTASRWQVRQPIYKSSLNRWKRYEPYLDPLIESLGGWDWIDRQLKT
ncbi:MAG TPA: sulfotransferase, partial [Rhizobiales bacterium]|nr:sulfotransferase [Hyphomicrobiales bacterium]